jgi:hypothetical protein
MLRDTRVGLIEPTLAAREFMLSRCKSEDIEHRTIDPHASKIPAPKGRKLNGRRRQFSISSQTQRDSARRVGVSRLYFFSSSVYKQLHNLHSPNSDAAGRLLLSNRPPRSNRARYSDTCCFGVC